MSRPNADPLTAPLADWRVAPSRNPNFRTEVWARIDAARRPANWGRFARGHRYAVTSLLAAAVLLGAWSGRSEAREHASADRSALAANYVHGLDARWMRHP